MAVAQAGEDSNRSYQDLRGFDWGDVEAAITWEGDALQKWFAAPEALNVLCEEIEQRAEWDSRPHGPARPRYKRGNPGAKRSRVPDPLVTAMATTTATAYRTWRSGHAVTAFRC